MTDTPETFDRHMWIIRMLQDGPMTLRQLHAASTEADHGTLDRLLRDLHQMVDEGIISMGEGTIGLVRVPYTYVHTETRRLQRMMDSAIRTGGLTVRQVNRIASLLVAIEDYYQDENEKEGKE